MLQGSILGPLLFILYINMKHPLNCDLVLYKGDPCLVYQQKYVSKIEESLNNFFNVCDWFFSNKLSINFGQSKTKSILCGIKQKLR